MTPEEMESKVCGPKMTIIDGRLEKLTKVIMEENGGPSLLSRLRSVEQTLANPSAPVPSAKRTIIRYKGAEVETTQAEVALKLVAAITRIILAVVIAGAAFLAYQYRLDQKEQEREHDEEMHSMRREFNRLRADR